MDIHSWFSSSANQFLNVVFLADDGSIRSEGEVRGAKSGNLVPDEEKSISMLKFLEVLDNCEDVQNVFGNFNLHPNASENFN